MAGFGIVSSMTIYAEGNIQLGVASVELPNVEFGEDTFNNSGTGGEMNIVNGRLMPMVANFTFEKFFNEQYQLMKANSIITIEATIGYPDIDQVDGQSDVIPVRHIMKGQFKSLTSGSAEYGSKIESEYVMNVHYYRVEQDGIDQIEVDPLNPLEPYKVEGVSVTPGDLLRAIF